MAAMLAPSLLHSAILGDVKLPRGPWAPAGYSWNPVGYLLSLPLAWDGSGDCIRFMWVGTLLIWRFSEASVAKLYTNFRELV